MLETVREYALERFAESAEEDVLRRRHLSYLVALAEEAEPQLEAGQQREWLQRLEAELGNVRGALAFALEAGEAERALRLAAALRRFWQVHGHLAEGRRWL